MGADRPKQYLEIRGVPVIEYTVRTLLEVPRISGVVVVLGQGDDRWPAVAAGLQTGKPVVTARGGLERCHSVLNGLKPLKRLVSEDDWVLVHDAARPCLDPEDVNRLIDTVDDDTVGGILATPISDTVKRSKNGERISGTVPRSPLWSAQTPQMFRYRTLRSALEQAIFEGETVTDEAEAVERAGFEPMLVPGSPSNIKITRPQDLVLASFYLDLKKGRP